MKQAKKKKRRTPITLVVLLVLLAVVSVELIRVYGQLDSAKSQRETMSQELEQQKKENSADVYKRQPPCRSAMSWPPASMPPGAWGRQTGLQS